MDVDEIGALKVVVMIVSMLVFATALVIFSCYRIIVEKRLRKKQQRLAPTVDEPSRIYNIENQIPQRSHSTAAEDAEQSDYQLIFGSTAINSSATQTDTFATSNIMVSHRPLTEYERRAQERRDNVGLNEFLSAPPYNPKDESLPSYDQAVKSQVNDE